MVRLITWNVARRASRLVDQAGVVAAREPDFVGLQEVTRRTLPLWRRAFELMGLTHVRASATEGARAGAVGRRTFVMIGSRVALTDLDVPLALPWPETAVSMLAQSSLGPLEINCVHVPNAANGWVKVETLRALRHGLETRARAPRVLCGDLNTPRRELPDGKTISFACDSRGRLRPDRGRDWDAAELGVVPASTTSDTAMRTGRYTDMSRRRRAGRGRRSQATTAAGGSTTFSSPVSWLLSPANTTTTGATRGSAITLLETDFEGCRKSPGHS